MFPPSFLLLVSALLCQTASSSSSSTAPAASSPANVGTQHRFLRARVHVAAATHTTKALTNKAATTKAALKATSKATSKASSKAKINPVAGVAATANSPPMPYADWNVPGVGTPFGDGMPYANGLGMASGPYNGGSYNANPSPPYNGNYNAATPGGNAQGGVPAAPPMAPNAAHQMSPPGEHPDKGMGGNGIPTGRLAVFPPGQSP